MARTRDITLTGVARRNGSMLELRERNPSADWYGMIDALVDRIPNPASVIRGAANNLAAPIRYYWTRGPDGNMLRRLVGKTVRAVGTGLRAADRITYRIGDTAVNLTLATAGLGAGAVRAASEGLRARRLQEDDNVLQRAFAEAQRQSELEEAYFQAMAQQMGRQRGVQMQQQESSSSGLGGLRYRASQIAAETGVTPLRGGFANPPPPPRMQESDFRRADSIRERVARAATSIGNSRAARNVRDTLATFVAV